MLQHADKGFEKPEHEGKAADINGEINNAMPVEDGFVSELFNSLHVAIIGFPFVHLSLLSLNMRVDPEAVNGH